jgi:hypothetical protein
MASAEGQGHADSMQSSPTPPNPVSGSSGERVATDSRRLAERNAAAPSRSSAPGAHSRQEAEAEDIVRALRKYGVLTRPRLLEVCGAAHWSDTGAKQAIAKAVASGRIRPLGDELYEITERSSR